MRSCPLYSPNFPHALARRHLNVNPRNCPEFGLKLDDGARSFLLVDLQGWSSARRAPAPPESHSI
jgi:hypothetical protein